jgi:hypothetical protein
MPRTHICNLQEECEREAAADQLRYAQQLAALPGKFMTLPGEYAESTVTTEKASTAKKEPSQEASQAASEKPSKALKRKEGIKEAPAAKPRAKSKSKASKALRVA